MRKRVTLDPDVFSILKALMRRKEISLSEAVNQAVRAGVAAGRSQRCRRITLKSYRMGYRRQIDLRRALSLAASMEDSDRLKRMK